MGPLSDAGGLFGARSRSGLGKRLRRDSERGIAARRFVVIDPFVSLLAMTGTILAVLAAEVYAADEVASGSRVQAGEEGGFRSVPPRWYC